MAKQKHARSTRSNLMAKVCARMIAKTAASAVRFPGRRPQAHAVRAFGTVGIGSFALGALATSWVAIGSLLIGRLTIGRIAVRDGRIKRLRIDDLEVGRVRLPSEQPAAVASVNGGASVNGTKVPVEAAPGI